MKKKIFGFLFVIIFIISSTAISGVLVVNCDSADPAPNRTFKQVVKDFEKKHPDIKVKLNIYDRESYKKSIRNWLASEAPDVVFWYAGERLNTFVSRGLLDPITDVWDQNDLHNNLASSRISVTFNGKPYGLPYSYYQWGVYYRTDLFKKNGLNVPKTWNELLHVCKTLKQNGVAPFTIGTKYLWTAAGWFDYMNLRINGLPFHLKLMRGEVSYQDPKVKAVFEKWKELIEPEYYIKNHTSYSWQEAQAFLFQGKAAMYLMGNFMVPNFPEEIAGKMSYFPFPTIDPSVPSYEDAPTDIMAIPKRAKNKADAKKFLAFIAEPGVMRQINDGIGQLPTHKKAGVGDDPYLKAGFKLLSGAKGLAQFYDRDTKPEMASVGMKGFQEFMVKPKKTDLILKRLEKARKRIYKKK